MTAPETGPRRAAATAEVAPASLLVLARTLAAGGATRSEIAADLAPAFTHKMSPAEWRRLAEKSAGELVRAGLASEQRSRLTPTPVGRAAALAWLGRADLTETAWPTLRDVLLVARALGIAGEGPARLKALARPDDLRAFIVQQAFGLPLRKNEPAAKLRAKLAVVALERAFGNKIKAGLGKKGTALSAKAGRLLAGQLSLNPREFGSDAKLVVELAAEAVGSKDSDADSIRAALLRRLGAEALAASESARSAAAADEPPIQLPETGRRLPRPANDRGVAAVPPPASARPDLAGFARSVTAAAETCAEGWPGNRKAMIARVWNAVRAAEPRWGLSEIEFKCMLAEAHRAGALVLANADLKSRSNVEELERSAVPYKNTVWHFVRLED